MDYYELGHILSERHHISWTEYNLLLPWEIDVKFSLIRRDQEEAKERTRQGQTFV